MHFCLVNNMENPSLSGIFTTQDDHVVNYPVETGLAERHDKKVDIVKVMCRVILTNNARRDGEGG